MTVYIMICEGCYDGEPQGTIVHVYATLERAREDLKRAINGELAEGTHFGEMWKDPERRKDLIINEREYSWEAYEDGWEANNHASCYIVEREVVA